MTDQKNPWKTLNSKIVYKNEWYQLREDQVIRPDGSRGSYTIVETRGPAVFVLAISDENEVYLIGQYRYTTNHYSWEIPGGSADDDGLLEGAKRELLEETGLVADNWEKAGQFESMNGVSNEISHVFIARGVKEYHVFDKSAKEMKKEGIDQIRKVPLKELLSLIKNGEITDGQTIACITIAAFKLQLIVE